MTGSSDRARDGILDQPKKVLTRSPNVGMPNIPAKKKKKRTIYRGGSTSSFVFLFFIWSLQNGPQRVAPSPPPPAFPAKVTSMSEMNYIALSPPAARSAGRSSPRFGCPISKQCGRVSKMR
ncbi:hypothetical protein CABS01_09672 [Colletotrichum abscissum]|uniref:uncharacterized protein n=1 Tax=Colletotrichum abscissum TaxID=1671311 RepID=UPI0027D59757|nr:uncharacterized protein CABS01_09672 [Colletotrichum abscissum]KAK1501941.1 hypothetical protein CABS01_09672 [Colletotrichum abscissum]